MAIYYVNTLADAGGDGTTSATTGEHCAWDTIADVNAASFSAGDSILFNKGCTWREQLTVPSSGSVGSPITFGAYGTGANPIINGADLVTTWSDSDSDVWEAACTTQPYQVFFDGTKGTLVASEVACNSAGKWFWASNVLYIYSTSDPDTAFTSPGIEASARRYCIYASAKDYITVDGFDTTKAGAVNAASYNVAFSNSDYGIIQNFTTTYGHHSGIYVGSGAHDCLVYNVEASYNGPGGVGIGVWDVNSDDNEISYCDVHDNYSTGITNHGAEATPNGPDGTWIHHNQLYDNGGKGISVTLGTNSVVEYNTIYGNGSVDVTDGIRFGSGDLADFYGTGNICRYNTISTSTMTGIYIYYETDFQIYYNLIYNNGDNGIQLSHHAGGAVYNNTLYNNNEYPILITQTSPGANVLIKNNVIHTSTNKTYGIFIYDAAVGHYTSDYNCIYETYFGRIETGGNYSLADWRTATGQDAHSMLADPLFVSTVTPDFRLQSGSPCKDAGVEVGLTLDYAGKPVPINTTPDIGAYEFQGLSLEFNPTLIATVSDAASSALALASDATSKAAAASDMASSALVAAAGGSNALSKITARSATWDKASAASSAIALASDAASSALALASDATSKATVAASKASDASSAIVVLDGTAIKSLPDVGSFAVHDIVYTSAGELKYRYSSVAQA